MVQTHGKLLWFWQNIFLVHNHCAYGKEFTQIYGPSLYNDYGAEVYPGVDDAIQTAKRTNTSESWQSVQHEVHRIARVISQAASVLGGGLT
jgi:hypothetical protein